MYAGTVGAIERKPKLLAAADGSYRYGLGCDLGEGSYGVVREGIHLGTCAVVAIKTLDKRLLKKQRRGLENLKREIHVLKLLGSHSSIVALKDVIDIESKNKIHLVLEYMHCGDVQNVLDRAPEHRLGQAQARRYFGGLLLALEHCHSLGVIHKDVKPANMLLDRVGNVHLSDFGCAELLARYKPEDTCVRTLGSPAFQSPEIATGKEEFSGFNADVWAAGVTLYQMVCGRTPFDAGERAPYARTVLLR